MVIIPTVNTWEHYERKKRLDYFLVIDEAHLLLQNISLIEITKDFDKIALKSVNANDIKHFAWFRINIIVDHHINEKSNRIILLISWWQMIKNNELS